MQKECAFLRRRRIRPLISWVRTRLTSRTRLHAQRMSGGQMKTYDDTRITECGVGLRRGFPRI